TLFRSHIEIGCRYLIGGTVHPLAHNVPVFYGVVAMAGRIDRAIRQVWAYFQIIPTIQLGFDIPCHQMVHVIRNEFPLFLVNDFIKIEVARQYRMPDGMVLTIGKRILPVDTYLIRQIVRIADPSRIGSVHAIHWVSHTCKIAIPPLPSTGPAWCSITEKTRIGIVE